MRIVIILCLVTFLLSCGNKKSVNNTIVNEQESIVSPQTNDILMEISPTTLPAGSEKVELKITNHTDTTLEFGAPYIIERFDDTIKSWKELPMEGVAFIMIMYMLPPGNSQTYDIYLYPDKIEYTPGLYQIKKQFFTEGENQEVQAQFTLE